MKDPDFEFYDDYEEPCSSCPNCMRSYSDIEYDFQWCQKCGWDEEKKEFTKPMKPTQDDYLSGDADILTGRWY